MIEVLWDGCKNVKDLIKIPTNIPFGMDTDWIGGEGGTISFSSLDDAYRAIKAIYPLATYSMEIDNSHIFIHIENFDNHLYELKEYRNGLNK